MLKILFSYFACVNALAFIVMALDKWYAVKNKWRIPEYILLATALLGGGVGMVTAMVVARHKLSKAKFRILGPLSILAYVILFAYLIFALYV